MSEIDLIPSDYRRRLQRLRQVRLHAVAAVLLLVAGTGAYAGLAYAKRHLQEEVNRLQQDKAITEGQRAELEILNAEHERLAEQVRLQDGLSGGLTAQRLFMVVDRALREDEVWFTRWGFLRSGKPLDKPEEAVSTGYILIIPKEKEQAEAKSWRIDTQMTIHGQALNHEALSAFVGRLVAQPEVAAAHLLKASLLPQMGGGMVEFELLVSINMAARS